MRTCELMISRIRIAIIGPATLVFVTAAAAETVGTDVDGPAVTGPWAMTALTAAPVARLSSLSSVSAHARPVAVMVSSEYDVEKSGEPAAMKAISPTSNPGSTFMTAECGVPGVVSTPLLPATSYPFIGSARKVNTCASASELASTPGSVTTTEAKLVAGIVRIKADTRNGPVLNAKAPTPPNPEAFGIAVQPAGVVTVLVPDVRCTTTIIARSLAARPVTFTATDTDAGSVPDITAVAMPT